MGYVNNPTTKARYSTRRKAARILKSRYKNHEVKGAMRKPRRTTVNKRQTSAIYTLGRQVRSLQLSQYGDIQYQYQYCTLTPSATNPTSLPGRQQPIFFAANCFYAKTQLYNARIDPNTHLSVFAPLTEIDGTVTTPVAFKKQAFDVDIDNRYQWNEMNNQNTVSTVAYLPISMKYKFTFRLAMASGLVPRHYRITFFKTKNGPIASDKKDFLMPGAAGAYAWMCCRDLALRNYFSKSYHQVLVDKWVTLNAPADGSRMIEKCVEIPYAFRGGLLQPSLTNDPVGQQFWTNLPSGDVIWCLISSDIDMSSYNGQPQITIQRSLVWRDKHGTTPFYGSAIGATPSAKRARHAR